jgi:hypothetical protein
MESNIFEIKTYMIIWRQLERRNINGVDVQIRGMVRCTGDEYTMDLLFLAPGSAFPDPYYDVANKKGFMFLPIEDLVGVVDTLRNERPIYGHLRGDRPEWMSVTTGQEPVGEGEDSS